MGGKNRDLTDHILDIICWLCFGLIVVGGFIGCCQALLAESAQRAEAVGKMYHTGKIR